MTINVLDRVVAGAMTLFGLWMAFSGIQMGVMQGHVPGAGLFPTILGIGIAILSLINLFRAIAGTEKLPAGLPRKEVLQVLFINLILIGVVIAAPWLGLTVAAFVAAIVVGAVLQEKKSLRFGVTLFLVCLVTAAACLLIFRNLLKVPVLAGTFGF